MLGLARVSQSAPPPADARSARALVVAADGSWFRAPDRAVADCSNRPVLKRLVAALVAAHRGVPCTSGQLVEAGWPGEKMSRAAARNRLHVSLNRLRVLGLGDVLRTTRAGYLIDPDVEIELS